MKIIQIEISKNDIYRAFLSKVFSMPCTNFGKDEVYYCLFKNNEEDINNIIAISRTCFNFNKHYLTQKISILNEKIKLNQMNIFFTGIWVAPNYRNQGVAKKILNHRFHKAKGFYVFTDARKDSSLLSFYLERGLEVIGEDKEHCFLYGEVLDV